MARTSNLTNKFFIVDVMVAVRDGNFNKVSRFLMNNLREAGFIEPVFEKASHGKGRKIVSWEITGKGRGYLALSRSWKRPYVAKTKTVDSEQLVAA